MNRSQFLLSLASPLVIPHLSGEIKTMHPTEINGGFIYDMNDLSENMAVKDILRIYRESGMLLIQRK